MKKCICVSLVIGVVMLGSVGCQSTPDEAVVVDKSEGIAKENIIPVENNIPKDLDIPEHWEEEIERNDGQVVVSADYDMQIEEIYNTPVYLCEIELIDEKMLEKLCTYFSEGNVLYEEQLMTKDELIYQKEKMESYFGNWAFFRSDYYNLEELRNKIKRVEELIEKAPSEKEKLKYIDKISFSPPYQTEYEYVMQRGKRWDGWNSWYYDTDKKIGFLARVDCGERDNPIIRALNYDDEVGSTTQFLYSNGYWIDEITLENDMLFQKDMGTGGKIYKEYLENLEKHMQEEASISKEEALEIVDNLLEELSINDVKVAECVKVIGNSNNEAWMGLDDLSKVESGYSIYLYPELENIIGYNQPYANLVYDLPETTYAPRFLTEQIHIVITENGIQKFEWTDISERIETIAENTKLLSFNEIKEKLADHFLYQRIGIGTTRDDGYRYRYDIVDVQFRATYVNAYNNPKKTWLVPVWVFVTKDKGIEPGGREYGLADSSVVINAIDGGIVLVQE